MNKLYWLATVTLLAASGCAALKEVTGVFTSDEGQTAAKEVAEGVGRTVGGDYTGIVTAVGGVVSLVLIFLGIKKVRSKKATS